MTVHIAIVNDDEVVVRGVDAMLRHYRDQVEIVPLDAAVPLRAGVDIALYDTFGMGQGDGPRVADLVANPRVAKVAVYTWNFQPWLIRKTLAQGVVGYLSKALSAAQLVEALLEIHAGSHVTSAKPGRQQIVGGDWPGREEGLTAREAEVLSLISMGLSNQEIAERTCLSHNSIKTYIRTCYRKIGVTSRTKAVLWGVGHGMLPAHVRAVGSSAREQAGDELTA